jgi:hypothetical protein
LNPEVPEGLQLVVRQMMAKDPEERYATPRRAADALRPFLALARNQQVSPENDPGMRAYLDWLDGQVLHADLPTWLAEMDTVRIGDLRKAKSTTPSGVRATAPVRPSNVVARETEIKPPSERTKVVRKLSRPARSPDRPGPPPDDDSVNAVPESGLAAPAQSRSATDSRPSINALNVPPHGSRQSGGTRRGFILFVSGLAFGALATLIGFLVAPLFRSEPPAAAEAPGRKRRSLP